MGNEQSQSHVPSPEFELLSRRFSASELQDLRQLFLSLALQSNSEGKHVTASVFEAHFGIHGALGARLFDVVTQLRKDGCMYFDDLVMSKAKYEKGLPDEVERFIYQVLDVSGDGVVQRIEVEAAMSSILETVLGPSALAEESLQGFLHAASFSSPGDGMSMEDVGKWCALVPSVKRFLGSLLTVPSAGPTGRQLPKLTTSDKLVGQSTVVLKREHAWHICGMLQQEEAQEWMLCYHSSVDGLSFNTFIGNMAPVKGATILLVRDKAGCEYGGYASQPWEKHSDFYGDMKSFLFTLRPRACIYRASGWNRNMQWCGVNFSSDSIPNGVGFGGQINHFGLFLCSTFEQGHSRPCVTFNSPGLSHHCDIIPDVIECWAVLSKGKDKGDEAAAKGTILERFKEERNMLNLLGIANASA